MLLLFDVLINVPSLSVDVLITNNIYFHENRSEIYGPACRVNLLHYVVVFVSCPETTKVN